MAVRLASLSDAWFTSITYRNTLPLVLRRDFAKPDKIV